MMTAATTVAACVLVFLAARRLARSIREANRVITADKAETERIRARLESRGDGSTS